MKNYLYSKLLRMDCAVLVSDNLFIVCLKRKILKPIGYYFRKKYFNINYK